MASARGKSGRKPKKAPRATADKPGLPEATIHPTRREIDASLRRRGQGLVGLGGALLLGGVILAMTADGSSLSIARILLVFSNWLVGVTSLAVGASLLDRRAGEPATLDKRRWIYGVLATLFALIYGACMWKVIPNRLPSAFLHLATVPMFTVVMAVGTLMGNRVGWWLGVLGGSIVLLSTIVLIARILASAAFLAGVYGAFGKAASTFSLVSVALIIEVVGILPICQVKFLMSRPGKRAYGI